MSRVYKRKDCKYWSIDYLTPEGVRVREAVGPNKAVAEKVLQKRLVMIAENKHLDIRRNPKVKFNEMVEKYIELYLKPNRPTWWKSEKHNLRHLCHFFGKKHLHEITSLDVEKFKLERLKTVGKNSVNKSLGCLRAMFNKAIEWNLYRGKNPVTNKQLFRLDNKRVRYLEKEEITRLLGNCSGHLKDIVEFAINTGMRKGEIFNLKWHDVDFNSGLVHLLVTKSGYKREIPINESVKNILTRVRKNPESPYVFSSYDGKPFNDIKRAFKTALIKSQIDNFRFHDLRHTFASQLVMCGVDLLTVKELLGHRNIEMTLRYAHLSCDHKRQAIKALDGLNGTHLAQSTLDPTLSIELSDSYALK